VNVWDDGDTRVALVDPAAGAGPVAAVLGAGFVVMEELGVDCGGIDLIPVAQLTGRGLIDACAIGGGRILVLTWVLRDVAVIMGYPTVHVEAVQRLSGTHLLDASDYKFTNTLTEPVVSEVNVIFRVDKGDIWFVDAIPG